MTFKLPAIYNWQGTCIVIMSENVHGVTRTDLVAAVVDEELFACYLADHVDMATNGLLGRIARMTPYTIGAPDDNLEDAVATMNALIHLARDLQTPKASEEVRP